MGARTGIRRAEHDDGPLELYFEDIRGDQPLTLEEIGTIFGLSRERIRQIKERALGRLRKTRRRLRLEPYLV